VTRFFQERESSLTVSTQREGHRPRLRVDVWIVDRHLVVNRVRVDQRQPLDHVRSLGVEVTCLIEPGPSILIAHIDDERVSLPCPASVALPHFDR
jgi:hypothetical protein